jgi:hypothetical protein
MFKRNQVEEAIAGVFEPGSAKPSSETRTRLKRLLETDRGLGRNKRSADPERAHFAFYRTEGPGRGVENRFSDYEALALLIGLRLMRLVASPTDMPADQRYVLVKYGEEYGQTRQPLGFTITVARQQSNSISELSFLTAVHTAKGIAKKEGISEVFACK